MDTRTAFPDSKGDPDPKTYDSGTVDSGFVSSGNHQIVSEEIDAAQEAPMRLDSGVDLAESFSGLDLAGDQNDLSKEKVQLKEASRMVEEEEAWRTYFLQDEEGDTFLHLAIVQGIVEAIPALIRLAPHPLLLDTPNDSAQTPLHLAAATGQWRVLRWLVVAGARPNPRNAHGDSPLHVAARNGDLSCCLALLQPVKDEERTKMGLSYPKRAYAEVSLDQWNYEGQTSIHVASIHGHLDVVQHLIWYGCDVNARDGRQGYTALHYAISSGHERLAQYLLFECPKLDAAVPSYGGRSVLQMGAPLSAHLAHALRAKGVASEDEEEEEDEEEDDEESTTYDERSCARSAIGASA